MSVKLIGDWALEDRLSQSGKPIVVLFMNCEDPKAFGLRSEFRKVARQHGDADFYEIDLLENPSLEAKYNLPQGPMVLVFVDGTEVARHLGTLMAVTVDRVLRLPPRNRD
jgi:hypothetical protein